MKKIVFWLIVLSILSFNMLFKTETKTASANPDYICIKNITNSPCEVDDNTVCWAEATLKNWYYLIIKKKIGNLLYSYTGTFSKTPAWYTITIPNFIMNTNGIYTTYSDYTILASSSDELFNKYDNIDLSIANNSSPYFKIDSIWYGKNPVVGDMGATYTSVSRNEAIWFPSSCCNSWDKWTHSRVCNGSKLRQTAYHVIRTNCSSVLTEWVGYDSELSRGSTDNIDWKLFTYETWRTWIQESGKFEWYRSSCQITQKDSTPPIWTHNP